MMFGKLCIGVDFRYFYGKRLVESILLCVASLLEFDNYYVGGG